MPLRIYDIIATNPGQELASAKIVGHETPLYTPNNLGGGYTRNEAGQLGVTNGQISFKMIFQTTMESTGYEKYLDVVTALSQRQMVWLRYAVPTHGGYTYAYRPGYVSDITKTEGSYAQASLLETITISTVGAWQMLYTFTQAGAARSLHPGTASNLNGDHKLRVFSTNYPENNKAMPYSYPYWYGQIIEEVLRRGSWYNKWGNVLTKGSDVYAVFAVHAPNLTVSHEEKLALSQLTGSHAMYQATHIKGNGFASAQEEKDTKDKLADGLAKLKGEHIKIKPYNFKASVHNYTEDDIDQNGPFAGSYSSYLLIGHANKGGGVAIKAGKTDVMVNQFDFVTSGDIIIDTAPWANIYEVNGSSIGIDFKNYVKTGANVDDVLVCDGVTLSTIIMRREVLTI